ncbi:hypothetical protein ACFYKX_22160 [Cytobacillus sp. FJAT-54145]|uniref:ABC transporter permease n=1 Tax=Cytobacillus spartinae TaxID=3299023 RepID=A0ABW6KGC7_9BACI
MNPFLGLYKKDLIITQSWVITTSVLALLSFVIGAGLGSYLKVPFIFAITAVVILTLHIFYIPAYLISSLITEGHTQLWLHNPNSGHKLFLSKLFASLTYFIPSILTVSIISNFAISNATHLEVFQPFEGHILQTLFLMMGGITLGSIYLGIWIFFYWSLYQALRNVPLLKRVRWMVIFALWLIIGTIGNFIKNSAFYQELKEIRFVDWKFNVSESAFLEISNLSLIPLFLHVLLSIVIFLLAVWIFERKVEV